MDFLDPRKRRAYNIRLVVGYILIAIVIGLGTVVLVYGANGYGFNTKTGQIVQNGLLFTDSHPGGAEIFLNGSDQHSTTAARLILPAGDYTLTLQKDGYRSWTRKFILAEQSVARYVYPFLFPTKPRVTDLKTYSSPPGLITQTPDQHWLLVEVNSAGAKAPVFDEYDTTTLDQTVPVITSLSFPDGLLTDFSAASKLTEVEWSSDNNNLLLQHIYPGGTEFVVFSRVHPDQSFNVNKIFNANPTQVNLLDKKIGQLYLYNQADSSLQVGDTGTKQLAPAILKHVLAYKPYGKDLVTYVTDTNEPAGKVAARIWNNGQTYKLYEFNAGNKYFVDAAQFAGHFYYVVGSDTSDRINIYKDPLSDIKNSSLGHALPLIALRDPGTTKLSFSKNTRFIEVENSQRFAVYDIETKENYQYPIAEPITTDLVWMDGHRLIGQSGGSIFVMDYDGTNRQLVAPAAYPLGGLFSSDYNHLMTVNTAADGTSVIMQDIDMRAGVDLPKK